ncbi:MAG: hypothetical protein MI743_11155 [Sneathiellales bacterium]|nr:hypothetical protein [Sneathiellales bacterium]
MLSKIHSVILMVVTLACYGIQGPLSVEASERTVLIVKEGEREKNEIASRLYQSLVNRISDHLQKAGYNAEEAGSLVSGSDEILLRQIRASHQENVQYVALVRVLANMVLLNAGTRVDLEISGRMLGIENGDTLARFDLPVRGALTAPVSCDRRCIIRLLDQNTSSLADELGKVLAQRLKATSKSE